MKELPGKLLSVFGGGSGSPSGGFARNSTGQVPPVTSVSEGGGGGGALSHRRTPNSSLEVERTSVPVAPTTAKGDDLSAFGSTTHIAQAAETGTRTPTSPRSDAGGNSLSNNVQGMSAGNSAAQQPVVQWMVRVSTRTQELCKYFNLPQEETLLDEFSCALRKRVLLQGRIYIFDHFVCFSSNVFGYTKKKVMPFQDLVAVRKKTHFRFPNSIEVEDVNGQKEFFTSFLSREDAYRLITNCWSHCKANRQEAYSQRRNNEGSVASGGSNRTASNEMDEDKSSLRPDAFDSRMGTDSGHDYENDDDDGEEEDATPEVYQLLPGPVPAAHPDYKLVLKTSLPGTPRDFYDVVLADDGHFFEDFLEKEGNRRINLTNWKRHEALGHVRDMQFTAPIKGAFGSWGVSTTQCYQSHRMSMYQPDHIVFESSQTMTDIPYGDCFTVDMRWDVEDDPASTPEKPMTQFAVYERTPFTRSCLFKKVIESGSFRQVQENYTNFVTMVRPVLQETAGANKALCLREGQQPTPINGNLSGAPSASRASRSQSMAKNEAEYDTLNARLRNRTTIDNLDRTPSDTSRIQYKVTEVSRTTTPVNNTYAPPARTSAKSPFNYANLLKLLGVALLVLVPLAAILAALKGHPSASVSHAPGSVGWSLPANRSAAPAYPYQHQPMHSADSYAYPSSQHDHRHYQPDHRYQQQQQQRQHHNRRHAPASGAWGPPPSSSGPPKSMQPHHSSSPSSSGSPGVGTSEVGDQFQSQPMYALDAQYWAMRLEVLQQELQLLSSRVNTVSSEVTLAMHQLSRAAQKQEGQSTISTPAPFATSPPFAESSTSGGAGVVNVDDTVETVLVVPMPEAGVVHIAA